jgi:hypothetical protein
MGNSLADSASIDQEARADGTRPGPAHRTQAGLITHRPKKGPTVPGQAARGNGTLYLLARADLRWPDQQGLTESWPLLALDQSGEEEAGKTRRCLEAEFQVTCARIDGLLTPQQAAVQFRHLNASLPDKVRRWRRPRGYTEEEWACRQVIAFVQVEVEANRRPPAQTKELDCRLEAELWGTDSPRAPPPLQRGSAAIRFWTAAGRGWRTRDGSRRRSAGMPRSSPPTRTCSSADPPATATRPPGPPPGPAADGAGMRPTSTRRDKPASAGGPSTGYGPNWSRGGGSWSRSRRGPAGASPTT